jgi:hypothetical protein
MAGILPEIFCINPLYTVTVNREGKLSSWPTPVLFCVEDRPLPFATTKMTKRHVTMYVRRHVKNPSSSLFWIKTMTSTWLNLDLYLVTAHSRRPPPQIRWPWTRWCHVQKPTSCQAMFIQWWHECRWYRLGLVETRHLCMVHNDKYTISNDECAYFHFVYGLFNEKVGASYLTVINSSRVIISISFIFSCEKRNNSSQVQLNSHDQNDMMRLAKRSQEESLGQIILHRHSNRVWPWDRLSL